MAKEKRQLNNEHICALKIINHVYLETGRGCKTISITTPLNILADLDYNNYIFCVPGGYFPSTEGQEFLKQYECNTSQPGE